MMVTPHPPHQDEQSVPAAATGASERLLWDILNEHLDEGAYLYTQWRRALQSPAYTLARLERTVEARLLAQVDGLVVGGAPVRQKLLLPRLAGGGEGETFVAALALLLETTGSSDPAILDALTQAQGETRQELLQALRLFLPACLVEPLRLMLRHRQATARAAALEVLATHRRLSEQEVRLGLEDAALDVQEAGLKALRWLGLSGLGMEQLGRFLLRPFPAGDELRERLQQRALEAGLVLGHAPSVEQALAVGWGQVSFLTPWGEGLRLLGARLGRQVLPLLKFVLTQPGLSALHGSALQGLGLVGTLEAAELCLHAMHDASLARAAGEAFSLITGADLTSPALSMPAPASAEGEGGLEERFYPIPEEALPLANVPAVVQGWQAVRARLAPRLTYLGGQVMAPEVLGEVLRHGSLYRRRLVLCRAEVWTFGQAGVQWDALSRVQQLQDEALLRRLVSARG